ncbi:hypothetical protein [Paenibacillus sp. ISL-20]|uniref:hypothetical protein n=1 Tax=Paenibacillus sp. ISL-20 TaxID=2819163 RepID=UPI001BE8F154|nr:hypothetical protein [Paenibacillus sp. ISL-20]MBT2761872.1 hypothetical protein [Paenibacillus sp. ISL-20]
MEAAKQLTQRDTTVSEIKVITTPIDQYVYNRFDEHFRSFHSIELLAAVRSALPNTRKRYYGEYAKTPLPHRMRAVIDVLPLAYGHTTDGKPSQNEIHVVELLTDFLLADDLADGYLLRDRFREETDENSLEHPPLGGAARAYQEMEMNLLTPALLERRKVCECCLSYFIDTSPARNAKRCGPRCTRWSEMLRIRRHRNDGDDRKKRDRKRQQFEYPFYSPYELEHVNQFPERCYTDDSIDRKIRAKSNGGRKKPQGVTMDSKQVSTHFKPYRPSEIGESGAVTTKKRSPEVVERYLRMKYGDSLNTPYIST